MISLLPKTIEEPSLAPWVTIQTLRDSGNGREISRVLTAAAHLTWAG
jgi:hypothetical protein